MRLCDATKEGDTAAKSLIVGDRKLRANPFFTN
jgi:hypothetical protein